MRLPCCWRLTSRGAKGIFASMSTTALHVIELVKSLPLEDQQAVREALARQVPASAVPPRWERTPDGGYFNPDGIPNDHPFFKILEEDEAARRQDFGPPPPDLT